MSNIELRDIIIRARMMMAGNDEHQLVVHTYSSRTNQSSSLCSHTNSLNQARQGRAGAKATYHWTWQPDCHFVHFRDACNQPRPITVCHKQNKSRVPPIIQNWSKLGGITCNIIIATSLDNLYKLVRTIVYADGGRPHEYHIMSSISL